MESFPTNFNFIITNAEIINSFIESNKDSINNCRQYIYTQFSKYLEKKREHFFLDLSEYSEKIRRLMYQELIECFPLIMYVDKATYCSSDSWILDKISENKIESFNTTEYRETPEKLGRVEILFSRCENNEINRYRGYLFAPKYIIVVMTQFMVDVIRNRSANLYWCY